MTKKEALTFIAFGGTGDLAKKKLAPAFLKLISDGILKENSTIIGIGRTDLNDKQYLDLLIHSIKDNENKNKLSNLNIKYLKADFSKVDEMKKLADILPYCEVGGCNRIYYLATSFKLFPNIVK